MRSIADALEAPIVLPCDVTRPGELEAVFARIAEDWGRLDFLLHSLASSQLSVYPRREESVFPAPFR